MTFTGKLRNWNLLSLPIGKFETTGILHALQRTSMSRPLTFTMLALVIETLGGDVEEVLLDEVDRDNIYHAKLHLRQGNQTFLIDVRPSDGFALAITSGAPILIADRVLA